MSGETRRASAVSITISQNSNEMSVTRENKSYYVKIANSFEDRKLAFALACENYAEKGFCSLADEYIVLPQDFNDNTITINAYDLAHNIIGTVTAIMDDYIDGLPCDAAYKEEAMQARLNGQKVAEVVRLNMKKNSKNAQSILVDMINLMHVYSTYIAIADSCLIEVNPSHLKYYKKFYLFEQLSGIKKIERVNGAEGVLMKLDLQKSNAEVAIVGGKDGSVKSASGRTAYCYFMSTEDEEKLVASISRLKEPMSYIEKDFFSNYLKSGTELFV